MAGHPTSGTPDRDHLLEEWKQLYETCRLYRSQYLSTVSIVATSWVVGVGTVLSEKLPSASGVFVLAVLVAILALYAFWHVFVIQEARRVRKRHQAITELLSPAHSEHALDPTKLLRQSSLLTLTVVGIGLVITVGLICCYPTTP